MPKKRRATACDLCRSRKVRCDVLYIGAPCSSCSKQASHCAVSTGHSSLPEPKPQRAVPSARTHRFRINARPGHVGEYGPRVSSVTSNKSPRSTGLHDVRSPVNHGTTVDNPVSLHLPAYITPVSTGVGSDSLRILVQQDALAFPPPHIVDEIIRSFLCYVYPLLPILRLDTFLDALEGKPGHAISPLLFQAVLLAGAVFVDFSGFQHEGFQQCKDVQRTLFGRAKALYDMEVEVNPVTVVQSLLLMTYWHSRLNDFQGRVHWLRIAISLATEAGLHNPDLQYEEPAENHFRRRLWSCCIIRSSLVCIGERRQALVPQAVLCHHDPDLLKGDDVSLSRALESYSVAYTQQDLVDFGKLFLQELELCRNIQHILHTLYEFSGVRVSEPGIPIMTLIPKAEAMGSSVVSLDEKLRIWHGQASQLGAFEQRQGPFGSIVSLHSAVLEMLYYTSLSTVHRPMMLRQGQTDTATEALRRFSSSALRSSACRITEIARDLEINNQISFLPPVGTAMFIAASLQHLQDSMSTNLDECRSGSLYLGQVLRVFRLLTERYNHVNTAIEYIARVQNGNGEQFDHSLEWEERVSPTGRWETHQADAFPR
jgi:hypothetical protein